MFKFRNIQKLCSSDKQFSHKVELWHFCLFVCFGSVVKCLLMSISEAKVLHLIQM